MMSGPDPGFSVGGVDPFWRGFGLQRGHFSVKMYVKMKELGPVGGRAPARPPPPDPPMDVIVETQEVLKFPNVMVHTK